MSRKMQRLKKLVFFRLSVKETSCLFFVGKKTKQQHNHDGNDNIGDNYDDDGGVDDDDYKDDDNGDDDGDDDNAIMISVVDICHKRRS